MFLAHFFQTLIIINPKLCLETAEFCLIDFQKRKNLEFSPELENCVSDDVNTREGKLRER